MTLIATRLVVYSVTIGAALLLLSVGTLASAHEDGTEHQHGVSVDVQAGARVNAANASTTVQGDVKARIQEKKEEVQGRMEERKQAMEERREEVKQRFEERKEARLGTIQGNILQFVDRVEARFLAAIERLRTIADRIESRANKLEDQGINASSTLNALIEARTDLDTAEDLSLDLSTDAEGAFSASSTPREAFAAIRTSITAIKEEIKSAHRHLRDALIPLKASGKIKVESGNGTTTSTDVE